MVCPHCELAHPSGTTSCSRCGRTLASPDVDDTLGFDNSDATVAALKPEQPAVASGVITPPPADQSQIQTAVQFSGVFSLTLQPGTDFGPRYRIESLLGEGGMGTVYKASDKELGRTVALKLVRPEFAANPAAMARFRQELLLASTISHRNILRIHDLGDAGGIKFITMAYVEGQDLGRLLDSGRLPMERVLRFATQLCSALDAAHSENVVHRDLKPNNILIDSAGNLFVMDFGLAKSIETEATMMTRTGQILGTPRYMAPEQVEAKAIDHRADIYSLGLILYEMVSGEIPFQADSAMQLMYQRVTQTPKDVKLANPEVPDYLARIIMRCLEKDPDLRYQNAREILAGLEARTAPAPTAVRPQAQAIRIQILQPSRHMWLAAGAALVLAIALLLALPATRHRLLPSGGSAKTAARASVRNYLAILPFRIIGDADETRYLADGVADSVSARLGALSDVYVASAAAVNAALSKKEPPKIARAAGVTLLVQGTVQTSADRIAVTISLDDVGKNARNLFHQEFSGVRGDVLTLEDNIFDSLVNAMEIKRTNEELARSSIRPTENTGAYDLFLKGQNLVRTAQNTKGYEDAVTLFNEAVKLDPRFALAYAGLADSYLRLWNKTNDSSWTQKAMGAAHEAQALNDNLPEVHFVLGSVDTETGRTNEAVAELKRALQLAPNSDEALRRLGNVYAEDGRQQEAIQAFTKATEINPYSWTNYRDLGAAYFRFGVNEEALKAFHRIIELEPDRATGYANTGAVYYRMGRWNECISMFQKAISLDRNPRYYSNLGTTYFYLGQYNAAVQMFEQAVELKPNDVLLRGNMADAYRWSAQPEKAAAAYDQAIAMAYKSYRVNPRDAETLGYLAIDYAKKGDNAQAMEFIRRAREIDPKGNTQMYEEAVIYALAGRTTEALKSLGEALRSGYTVLEARNDPELKSLRERPEFQKLLDQIAAAGVKR
jgi:tetratricopeptide (TPR) repeat protein